MLNFFLLSAGMLTQGHCSACSIDKDQGLNEIFLFGVMGKLNSYEVSWALLVPVDLLDDARHKQDSLKWR